MSTEKFKELLEKYLSESIRPEEKKLLAGLLNDPVYVKLLNDLIFKELSDRVYELEPDDNIRKAIHQYLDVQTMEPDYAAHVEGQPEPLFVPVRRIHLLRTSWFRYAAAIIPVLGALAYFTINKKPDQAPVSSNRPSQSEEIVSGGNKAILTLSDGTTIVLDNAANGTIAQQGSSSIIKLANGQLAYTLEGLPEGEAMMNTMSTPRGGQYQLALPDGTRVWLNAASSITYPAVFVGKERKVRVTGEAYFEVARNKAKPFIVDIEGKSLVEVLGTHFNVNSYTDEGSIMTTLLEGSVKVSTGADSAIIRPGQQAQMNVSQVSQPRFQVINDVDMEKVMAWRNGVFNFNGADIFAVMRQISRWYDVEVRYEGKAPSVKIKGEMDRGLKLSEVLELLNKMEVHFRMENRTVVVFQKPVTFK